MNNQDIKVWQKEIKSLKKARKISILPSEPWNCMKLQPGDLINETENLWGCGPAGTNRIKDANSVIEWGECSALPSVLFYVGEQTHFSLIVGLSPPGNVPAVCTTTHHSDPIKDE